jgi:hypothetical protein
VSVRVATSVGGRPPSRRHRWAALATRRCSRSQAFASAALLHPCDGAGIGPAGGPEDGRARAGGVERAVDDDAVELQIGIGRRAEAAGEGVAINMDAVHFQTRRSQTGHFCLQGRPLRVKSEMIVVNRLMVAWWFSGAGCIGDGRRVVRLQVRKRPCCATLMCAGHDKGRASEPLLKIDVAYCEHLESADYAGRDIECGQEQIQLSHARLSRASVRAEGGLR